MSANSRRLAAIKSGKKPSAEHFCETTHDEIDTSAAEFLGHLDDSAKDFLVRLLARDPAERLGDAGVHSHAFFEEVNWAALLQKRVTPPWPTEALLELESKRIDESPDERRAAAQALGGMAGTRAPGSGKRMEHVENFDFVSPRALTEEYMENMYMLRQDDGWMPS